MEIKKVTDEMRNKLRELLPQEALKQHPTKTYLTSIKPMYVIERLNDVFGVGSWYLKNTVIDNKSVMIVIDVNLTIPEYGIDLSCFGGNDNGGEDKKGFDLGDAYKGAVTDALTKICSWLEIGIDVFKGIQNHPTHKTNESPINKEQHLKKLKDSIGKSFNSVADDMSLLIDKSQKYLTAYSDDINQDTEWFNSLFEVHRTRILNEQNKKISGELIADEAFESINQGI